MIDSSAKLRVDILFKSQVLKEWDKVNDFLKASTESLLRVCKGSSHTSWREWCNQSKVPNLGT